MGTDLKYCRTCKKMVAVINHGRPNKQRYQCKECGNSFVDRKYGIEVRSLAVRFRDFGYSYREISQVFGIKKNSPNSVRNWVKENCAYPIPYQERLVELKKYKELCESIRTLQAQLIELEKELSIARAYWQKKNEIDEIERKQSNINLKNIYEVSSYTVYGFEIDKLHKELVIMPKPKGFLTLEQIKGQQSSIKKALVKQVQLKDDIQDICKFARDNYDIDTIISVLQKITEI